MRSKITLNTEDALFMKCIYQEYCSLMFSVTKRFGLKKADQEDIVSTVLISLMNNAATLKEIPADERKYYITRAVVSACINHLKKQDALHKAVNKNTVSAQDTKPENSIEEQVDLRIRLINVMNSIMSLPEKESQCIRLKYIFGYTNAEIAVMTGLSENSVNQYIKRARDRIRSMLYSE